MTDARYQRSQSTFDSRSVFTCMLLLAAMGSGGKVDTPEDKVVPNSEYILSMHENTACSVEATSSMEAAVTNDIFEQTVTAFYSKLLSDQEELGSTFEKVLYQNISVLYES